MAAAAAGRDVAWADSRLAALSALLPGAAEALLRARVGDLARLMLLDDATLAWRLVELRCVAARCDGKSALLRLVLACALVRSALPPGLDAARLAAARPVLLLSPTPGADAAAALAALAEALPDAAAQPGRLAALLAAEPAFLDVAAVRAALAELARLTPDADGAKLLAADPALLRQATPPAPRGDVNDEYYV